MDQSQYKPETDWHDLIRVPGKLFGYSYVYFAVVVTGIGLMYVFNLTTIGKNSTMPAAPADSAAAIKDLPLRSPRILPPVDVMNAASPTSELVGKGGDLFKANCISCHGEDGKGDGPTAPTLNPKPRDFHSLAGWINGSKVTQIYKTLQEGIVGSGMASYNYMPPADRFALIHYVRSFASGQPQDSTADLKRLDQTYTLSKGMDIPGQIPVRKATRIVLDESKQGMEIIREMERDAAISEAPGAEVLRRVARDPSRIMTCVVHLQEKAQDAGEFIRVVTADPYQAGFTTDADRLTPGEWNALYGYLMSLRKKEG